MTCKICNKEMKSNQGLVKHIQSSHNIKAKDYYDKYLKQPEEGICPVCNKETPFLTLGKGYQKHCSTRCSQLDPETKNTFRLSNPQKNKEIRDKTTKSFQEKYNGRGYGSKLIQDKAINTKQIRYGKSTKDINSIISKYTKENNLVPIEKAFALNNNCGWIDNIEIIFYYGRRLIKKSDLPFIKSYIGNSIDSTPIIQAIREVYSGSIEDLYIPELNLKIQYHSNYEIALESNKEKSYILDQSILYREKGIRLIHIFEFEDLEHQLYLLKEFIKGNDLYKDFNKNNFLDIPIPEMIYVSGTLTIYGAGELL